MIKSPLAFFEVQVKSLFVNAFESVESDLCKAPECLDSVDVRTSTDEFAFAMMHPEMFFIANINQPVIAPPAVAVDDTSRIDSASDNGLQSRFLRIRDDLCVDFSIALEEPEDDGFAACAASSFASDTARTEVRFINLHLSADRRSAFTILRDSFTYETCVPVHRVAIEPR